MIGYLKGIVLEAQESKVLVRVGESSASGLGYLVSTPQRVEYQSLLPGSSAEFYVYTHVREDALDLFGFMTSEEKEVFLALLSVNGVGPKSALGILSATTPQHLVDAILEGDSASLTQAPGVGKKTAERVVLELRDKMKKKVDSGGFHFKSSIESTSTTSSPRQQRASTVYQDARSALVGLGYRENVVSDLLDRVCSELASPPQKAEDLIRSALKQLI